MSTRVSSGYSRIACLQDLSVQQLMTDLALGPPTNGSTSWPVLIEIAVSFVWKARPLRRSFNFRTGIMRIRPS